MAAVSKTKSRFNQVLLKIDARRFPENNQQKCRKCGCNRFSVPND